ncbi:MAG: hypothetical protein J6B77_02095 [Clostridia bacterium]|nr:hypothetical protein [Clostridia bacterium]
MDLKKLGKALLFPHTAVMIVLIPISVVLLVGAMVFVGTESAVAYVSYVLSAYTLTVWCFRIPRIIRFFKTVRNENPYVLRFRTDARMRIRVTLYGSFFWNTAYALFQLWLGFYHHTFWFYSLAGYYISLAVMRLFLVRYTSKHAPGENMRAELLRYRACGWVFLVMNLTLSLMIFFMIYWNRTFHHHEITTIAIAAYTFTAFASSIYSMVKYRRYNSPVYSAAKAISLASACVSMLTLTSTMLTTFGDGTMDLATQRIMLAAVGAAVSAWIILMALSMILTGTKKLKLLKAEEEKHGTKR